MVDHDRIAPQQNMQPPIAEAGMFSRKIQQPLAENAVVAAASIAASGSWNQHQLADVALADLELSQQAPPFALRATS